MTSNTENKISVTQCTHATSHSDDVVLTAILGSCVAVCAHDSFAKVGGMNHILLPGEFIDGDLTRDAMYGANLMELLLNDLYKLGAHNKHLEFKVFGGAKMGNNSADIGRLNYEFILNFMKNENLLVSSLSVGGDEARRIEFYPTTGRTRQKLLVNSDQIKETTVPVDIARDVGHLELF